MGESPGERAESLMRAIDARVGASSIQGSRFMRDRYLEILGALVGEIETAMNHAKELTFDA